MNRVIQPKVKVTLVRGEIVIVTLLGGGGGAAWEVQCNTKLCVCLQLSGAK
jgi:hypothetical protein